MQMANQKILEFGRFWRERLASGGMTFPGVHPSLAAVKELRTDHKHRHKAADLSSNFDFKFVISRMPSLAKVSHERRDGTRSVGGRHDNGASTACQSLMSES